MKSEEEKEGPFSAISKNREKEKKGRGRCWKGNTHTNNFYSNSKKYYKSTLTQKTKYYNSLL